MKSILIYRDYPHGRIFGIARDSNHLEQLFKSENLNVEILHKKRGIRFLDGQKTSVFLSKPSPVFVFNSKVTFLRIHDVFPVTNPEWFNLRTRLLFKISLTIARFRNYYLVFNSESTRLDYSSRYKVKNQIVI
jgi:hypothetical protein